MIEHMEHQAGARGERAEFGLEADQSARRNHVFEAYATLAVGLHVLELPAAGAELFHHAALELLFHVDDQLLPGFLQHAVDFAHDHFRTRYREFVAFAAHRLDEDREVQLATARHFELVRVGRLLDTQRDVVQCLARQAFANLATGEELAAREILVAGERRTVDLEGHADGRLVHGQRGQRFHRRRIADRVGNAQALDARDRDDVAGLRLRYFAALQAHEAHDLQHLAVAALAFVVDDRDRHVGAHRAALHAADADYADVARIIE